MFELRTSSRMYSRDRPVWGGLNKHGVYYAHPKFIVSALDITTPSNLW